MRQPRGRFVAAHFPQSGMISSALAFRSRQKPLPRNVVELQPYSVGILEQQRIIAGRPLVLARGANDLYVERAQKAVQVIDVGALAGAKTQMVQADAILLERGACVLG